MGQDLTVLLIEDDDSEAELFSRSAKRAGFNSSILRARDGDEGLDILREKKCGYPSEDVIVLLDLNLPKLSGLEFLRLLRCDPWLRSTVVFVLTTSDARSDLVEAYDLSIAGYVVKTKAGLEFNTLFQMIESYGDAVTLPPV